MASLLASAITSDAIIQFQSDPFNESKWNRMAQEVEVFTDTLAYSAYSTVKIIITISDGVCAFYSGKSNNSFQHFLDKSITDNLNTRQWAMTALLSSAGIGYETKYSSSTRAKQIYKSYRTGMSAQESLGLIAVSFQV